MEGKTLIKLVIGGGAVHSVEARLAMADEAAISEARRQHLRWDELRIRRGSASELMGRHARTLRESPIRHAGVDDFKSKVDAHIGRAEEKCSCEEDACKLGASVVGELRGLVAEMDSAIRNGGSPPSDAVQRQERIDNAINDASAAAERQK